MSPMLSIELELYCIFFELHSFNVENAGYMLLIFFILYLAVSTNIKSPGGPGHIKPAIKRPFAPLEGRDAQTEVKKTALFLKNRRFLVLIIWVAVDLTTVCMCSDKFSTNSHF